MFVDMVYKLIFLFTGMISGVPTWKIRHASITTVI
jgi:hypothetical protein